MTYLGHFDHFPSYPQSGMVPALVRGKKRRIYATPGSEEEEREDDSLARSQAMELGAQPSQPGVQAGNVMPQPASLPVESSMARLAPAALGVKSKLALKVKSQLALGIRPPGPGVKSCQGVLAGCGGSLACTPPPLSPLRPRVLCLLQQQQESLASLKQQKSLACPPPPLSSRRPRLICSLQQEEEKKQQEQILRCWVY